MVINDAAAAVALEFMFQDHSFLGPDPYQIRRELIAKYDKGFSFKNGIGIHIGVNAAEEDPLWPSDEEIDDYNKRYNLALLEEMKKKVTYEEYLAWGYDLWDVRPCEFRNGQCELFCEKFAECMGN